MGGAMNHSPASPITRATRAAMFAAIGVLLSAVGHAEVSGHGVSASALILAFAATGSVAWAAADRQRGIVAIGGGLLVMQVALHLWFGVPAVSGGHGASHAVTSELAGAQTDSLIMMAAHGVAALVCAVWLWLGERALFALLAALYARMLAPLLLMLVHTAVADAGSGVPIAVDRGAPPRSVLLRYEMARRGPPVGMVLV
ncbi:hypothetical protein [Nocardia sp. NBC_01009]|uniref:hypothetical protein n=1 Tax=Nocardia sp. NBC_01009 TaxID=2975996 RepID=UPI0038635205|nr:hypothetical protein OHA42_20115 [Nocardia sp. NBC_01009]